jgi:hypothetical protein
VQVLAPLPQLSNLDSNNLQTMGFWSRGNSEEAPASKDFTSSDEAAFSSSAGMSSPSSSLGGVGPGAGAPGGAGVAAEMQQFVVAVQEQMLIQETMSTIADKAFEKCITKPSDSLSGREAACIQAVSLKWLDTNQFLIQRMQKKMSAGQNQHAL